MKLHCYVLDASTGCSCACACAAGAPRDDQGCSADPQQVSRLRKKPEEGILKDELQLLY